MNIEQLKSGLLVATAKSPKSVPPPEHPARKIIREALATLPKSLDQFEQTSHVALWPGTIESVARHLINCYDKPDALSISNLAQVIDRLVAESEPTPAVPADGRSPQAR